jgi:TRAP-type C4-dicarboxylate transport system permease small subunit
MRAILITASVCAVATLAGLLGLFGMDIVPSAGAAAWRLKMMLIGTAFFAGWLGLAVWAWRRSHRSPGPAAPPAWLNGAVVAAGAVYVLAVLLFTVG